MSGASGSATSDPRLATRSRINARCGASLAAAAPGMVWEDLFVFQEEMTCGCNWCRQCGFSFRLKLKGDCPVAPSAGQIITFQPTGGAPGPDGLTYGVKMWCDEAESFVTLPGSPTAECVIENVGGGGVSTDAATNVTVSWTPVAALSCTDSIGPCEE